MLISQMLQVNVDTRFTAEEVLSHPWVTVRAHTDTHIQTIREELSFITLVYRKAEVLWLLPQNSLSLFWVQLVLKRKTTFGNLHTCY